METHYSVLKCDEKASKEELRKQYKKLALKTHPDKSESNNSDHFHRIDRAIKVLNDDSTRRQYDSQLIETRSENRIINDELFISDFTLDSETKTYWSDCRCGGSYCLTESDLSETKSDLVIDCNSCSLSVKLKFS